MKDIEDMLLKQPPKPKRPLKASFTNSIIEDLDAAKPSFWQRASSNIHRHLFTRAGAASLAAFVLLSGSVAAIALWPKPHVEQTMSKPLPSGNHIVGYDLDNCNYFSELNGAEPKETKTRTYYEIRKGSKLTDDELKETLRGVCEENISNNAITAVIKKLPQNTPGMQSTLAYTVEAVAPGKITVSLDAHYDAATYTVKPHMTYEHFASDLQVFDQSTKSEFSNLKTGDTVKMIVQDTSGKTTETTEAYNPLNHPEHIRVLAIVKIPALTADPTLFDQAVGVDLVRLEPCKDSPTGLCRVYNFAK